jgi:hypothetical protein
MSSTSEPVEYIMINTREVIKHKSKMHDYVAQIPWITYRDGFDPIDGFCSDSGWGCMIRVAQMMIAHTLTRHIKRRIEDHPKTQVTVDELLRIILPLFLDDYHKHEAPFGI